MATAATASSSVKVNTLQQFFVVIVVVVFVVVAAAIVGSFPDSIFNIPINLILETQCSVI